MYAKLKQHATGLILYLRYKLYFVAPEFYQRNEILIFFPNRFVKIKSKEKVPLKSLDLIYIVNHMTAKLLKTPGACIMLVVQRKRQKDIRVKGNKVINLQAKTH